MPVLQMIARCRQFNLFQHASELKSSLLPLLTIYSRHWHVPILFIEADNFSMRRVARRFIDTRARLSIRREFRDGHCRRH